MQFSRSHGTDFYKAMNRQQDIDAIYNEIIEECIIVGVNFDVSQGMTNFLLIIINAKNQ